MPDGRNRILVLGGTREAAELSRALEDRGHDVVVSLKGLTPVIPGPGLRTGGFGGVDGLVELLRADGFDALVDASHPFAARMSANAATAAGRAGVPHLRLLRPAWVAQPEDRWTDAADLDAAAAAVAASGARRVFLSVGRFGVRAFVRLLDVELIVRSISPPDDAPPQLTVVVDRGPFTLDGELRLFAEHRPELLVTRNSGGAATAPKLEAARRLGIPVLMVRRPEPTPGDRVSDVAAALEWVEALGR